MFDVPFANLERVLEALSEAVRECDRVIDRAKASGCDEYSDGVADDESDVVDSLVGTAFIATQTQITAVVSSIERVHRRAQKDRLELKSSDGTKEGIRGAGNLVSYSFRNHKNSVDQRFRELLQTP